MSNTFLKTHCFQTHAFPRYCEGMHEFLKQLSKIASTYMPNTNLNSRNQRKQGCGGGNFS